MHHGGRAVRARLAEYSILFADVAGFSRMNRFQEKQYIERVLPKLADIIHRPDSAPLYVNTWGDGVMAYFSSRTDAALVGLGLRDLFRNTNWCDDYGLPDLTIRIAIHSGQVLRGNNPVTRKADDLIGTEVNRAARIEPIVAPNYVFVTEEFCRALSDSRFRVEPLGRMPLAKEWGDEILYVLAWRGEVVEGTAVRAIATASDPRCLLRLFGATKYAHRLQIDSHAKALLGDYCARARSRFWRSGDVVFIDAGTVPLFLVHMLFSSAEPTIRPRLLITSNLACAMASMIEGLHSDTNGAVYPLDRPTRTIILGGRVLGDYATSIPEDLWGDAVEEELPQDESKSFWESDKLEQYFAAKQVNHIVMMVSQLTAARGPHARSTSMRRFKKLLLRYVVRAKDVRLSIVLQGEKLKREREEGWPIDDVELPGSHFEKFWSDALRLKRVQIIAALSPSFTEAEKAHVMREMRTLGTAGASCTLLDEAGHEVNVRAVRKRK